MALGMAELVFANGLGEEEGAPVRYTADDAIGGEDEGASGTCNSGGGRKVRLESEGRQRRRWDGDGVRMGNILLDLRYPAWADLRRRSVSMLEQIVD